MKAKMLDGKVAIISGASYGMGQTMAELFAAEGAKVVMTARGEEKLSAAVAAIKTKGYDATGVAADNKNLADVQKVIQTALDVYGGLDIVINNAAIGEQKMIDETDDEWLEHVYQTNVFGPFRFIRESLKVFLPKNEGCIINISSVNGTRPFCGAAYTSSKGAVNTLTKNVAMRLIDTNIRINAVAPGATVTPAHLANKAGEQPGGAKMLEYSKHFVYFPGPECDPMDQANACLFLASDMGKHVKGQVIQSHICSVWQDGQYKRTRNLAEAKAGFEEMMKLLQTDYLDVGMIHYCDALSDWKDIEKNGILDYAKELKAAGRIRHIGLSSHNPEAAERAVLNGAVEVLMFSVNPCYDLQPASEDVEEIWARKNYAGELTNMDPERQRLYETCQRLGVGVTVMKCFGGGDLLDAKLSPAGAALSVNQCIHYALTRPAVATVLAGAHAPEQLLQSLAYEDATEAEKDYAPAFAAFPRIRWQGHCMYCSHCAPCPQNIDVAAVTKFLHLAEAQKTVPETVREHYKVLARHAGDCVQCGACETRCPFEVDVRANMRKAKEVFGY